MIRICAWCKKYLGQKEPLEDLSETHDCCPKCLATLAEKIEAAQPAFREKYQADPAGTEGVAQNA